MFDRLARLEAELARLSAEVSQLRRDSTSIAEEPAPEPSSQPDRVFDRRALLAKLGGAAAAGAGLAAAGGVLSAQPAAAASATFDSSTGDAVSATSTATVASSGVYGHHTAAGTNGRGVTGESSNGFGVYAVSGAKAAALDDTDPTDIAALAASSQSHTGVLGVSTSKSGVVGVFGEGAISGALDSDTAGVLGTSKFGTGVKGRSSQGDGVLGGSTAGYGVFGFSAQRAGLVGKSDAPDQPSVYGYTSGSSGTSSAMGVQGDGTPDRIGTAGTVKGIGADLLFGQPDVPASGTGVLAAVQQGESVNVPTAASIALRAHNEGLGKGAEIVSDKGTGMTVQGGSGLDGDANNTNDANGGTAIIAAGGPGGGTLHHGGHGLEATAGSGTVGTASGGTGVIAVGGAGNLVGGYGVRATGGGSGPTAGAPLSLVPAPQPGPPTAGLRGLGDVWMDSNGVGWICTGTGAPGTWRRNVASAPGYNNDFATGFMAGAVHLLPNPIRVYDTRPGSSAPNPPSGERGVVPPSTSAGREIQVTGVAAVGGSISVPAGAVGVIGTLSVTGTGATNAGYLTCYAKGRAPTNASLTASITWFAAGQTLSTLVASPLSSDGVMVVHNGKAGGSAATHVIFDVVGFVI